MPPKHPTAKNWIANGSFTQGLSPWGAHAIAAAPGHEVRAEHIGGALCTQMLGDENVILGWPVSGSPEHFKLTRGKRYHVALRTAATGDLAIRCVVKIGHQVAPYTSVFSASVPTEKAWAAFATDFTPDHADDRAGLAVECQSPTGSGRAQLCIDDVGIYPNTQ